MMSILNVLLSSLLLSSGISHAARPTIMLTGYWTPTNEMLREFNQDPVQNPLGWKGSNYQDSGYDVISYFPEFKQEHRVGEGDFRVDFAPTLESFQAIVPKVAPVALISFGVGEGPWEVEFNAPDLWSWDTELNAPDFWTGGTLLHSTLPVNEIAIAVNETGIPAWVDWDGEASTLACGYLFRLGAEYALAHSVEGDPTRMRAQGFIHVDKRIPMERLKSALRATLEAVIRGLSPN